MWRRDVDDGRRCAPQGAGGPIAGAEDHYGDMDFKVAGTATGITALQMDIKSEWPSRWTSCARRSNRRARAACISSARWRRGAPRIITIRIPVEKIRDVIGSGGKTIRSLVERTGVKIDVEDDGRINIASSDDAAAQKAISIIQELTATPWVEITPGAPLVLRAGVEPATFFGTFNSLMSFGARDEAFDTDARKARNDASPGVALRVYVRPTLRLRVGRVLATSAAESISPT